MNVWHDSVAFLSSSGWRRRSADRPTPALIPSLVPGEDLPNAIALNSIQFNLARVIGPLLGGIALSNFGPACVLLAERDLLHRGDHHA